MMREFGGICPSRKRCRSDGKSLRWERSPVAPKTTRSNGGTGTNVGLCTSNPCGFASAHRPRSAINPARSWSSGRAAGAQHGFADEAHAVADVGGNGFAQRRGVLGGDRSDGGLMLVVERRFAQALVDYAHERAELQPQGFDELC